MRIPEEARAEFRELAMTVAVSAWHKLRALEAAGFEFSRKWTTRGFHPDDTGTYRRVVSIHGDAAATHFGMLFGSVAGYGAEILYSELDGAGQFETFVRQWPKLMAFLAPHGTPSADGYTASILSMPVEIAESHLYQRGWGPLDEAILAEAFSELERFWLEEQLPVELVIPILGVGFDTDRFELVNGCRIDRLTTAELLGKSSGREREQLSDAAIMATHALVIPEWQLEPSWHVIWLLVPEEPDTSILQLDRFFEAIAIISDAPSGYAEVITRPIGWAASGHGPVDRISASALVNKFSSRLDRTAVEPAAIIAADQLLSLRRCFSLLLLGEKTLEIAAHRLLTAGLRPETQRADRILDLCIGIESLLSDDSTDLTYKLGVRTAAVLGDRGWNEPSAYIDAMKAIYRHRSAIVHGRGRLRVNPSFSFSDRDVPLDDLARIVLRELLLARLARPELNPKAIDKLLVGAAFDSYWASQEPDAES
jgi:hypothetical protein